MFSVTKEFSFDSAHRLVNGYKGKCANIHGHTWRVRLTITGDTLNQYGFLWDFGDFKPIKEFIDQELDHAMLVAHTDEQMRLFCAANNQKYYVIPDNPTSENIARHLFERGRALGLPLSMVEIDETCTCKAWYAP